MNNKNEDINVIGMLRDKSEEAELNNILKSTFGGYTKKSVQEYCSALKKQQQASQVTFQKNLQALFEEKEGLKKNNEVLLARYNKLSVEYDNLSESLKNIKLENSDFSAQEFYSLKANILSLGEEVKIAHGDKKSLEKKINQLNQTIDDLKTSLQQSHEEAEAQKEMIKTERLESKKHREMVADLSRQLGEEKNEVKYLKSTMSDGKFHDLNTKISELNEQLAAQTEIIAKQNSEKQLKEKTIDTLNDEIAALKHRLTNMMQNVQNLNIQNDKLLVANDLLKTQLEEEYKRSISLINEKANIAVEKLIAQKKLSDAEAKVISLELKQENYKMTKDIKNIQTVKVDS